MAESTLSTMDAVAALMEERAKYEGWLTALEERRAATPARVYDRVRLDYQGRLDAVLGDLAGRATELEAMANALRERVDALRAEQERREEERAEAEIRAAVGEYTEARWDELRGTADADLAHVTAQLNEQRAELERVEEMLAVARAPRRGTGDGPGESATDARGDAAAAAMAERVPLLAPLDEIRVVRGSQAGEGVSRGERVAPFADREVAAPTGAGPEEGAGGSGRSGLADAPEPDRSSEDSAFDDLAFLKSIVEPTTPGAAGASSAGSGSAAPRGTTRGSDEARYGAPARGLSALRHILGTEGRSASPPRGGPEESRAESTGASTGKTLRCAECGTLNYPTEWYCERCGGELASV